MSPEEFASLFASRIDRSGACWIWTGHKNRQGYAHVSYRGKTRRVSRLVWELTRGSIPEQMLGRNGKLGRANVLHNCPGGDNPSCINPDHLWLGTDWDNARDRDAKGRGATGERASSCKLTPIEVTEIRRLRAEGNLYRDIADKFGVTKYTTRAVCIKPWGDEHRAGAVAKGGNE